jgi:hypothetical protein
MSDKTAGQIDADANLSDPACVSPETGMTDSALLEDALNEAVEAHEAGQLAAPFGLDEVALARARRRALRADLKRLIDSRRTDPPRDA